MAVEPRPFIPSFLRAALSGSRPITLTFSEVQDTNIESTASFIYDPLQSPVISTQQLNVDWSNFENHTFFMSAEAKVNLAFDQIINGYPFDGTRQETERFFENLTGFDNWVFEQFPKFRGQLHFSGTQVGEDTDGTTGTWIQIRDHVGALFPELAKNPSGKSVVSPGADNSFTLEMHVHVPSGSTDGYQVLFQKLSASNYGLSLYLTPTPDTTVVDATFTVMSGPYGISTTQELDKGKFNHVAFTLNREEGVHYLQSFRDGKSVDVSRQRYVIGDMGIDDIDVLIGTGSAMLITGTLVTPTQTFSGTLDELRVFHSIRTTPELQAWRSKSIYATDDLKLYYKFNEPSPPLTSNEGDAVNSISIDSSGHALHAIINNFTGSLREDASLDPLSLMIYEKAETTPILFPAHEDVVELNTTLLASAALYDAANPNLISRLIPPHYLLEGAALEGYAEPEGGGGNAYSSVNTEMPGEGRLGSVQVLLSFLYIFARFFDEIKLFVEAFGNLRHVDYDADDTIPNNFILDYIKQYGFHLPPLFNDSTLEQYIRAENIDREVSNSELSLKHVQGELLRRVLINMPTVLRSKGTQHSIKAFLRAVGIDPDNSIRIREFGGPTERQLSFVRETKREPNVMVDFITSSFAATPYLSASRLEVGFPEPQGTFVLKEQYPPHGISDTADDGLLTSGSWTVESIVKWTKAHTLALTNSTQSICRLCMTGSNGSEGGIVANLLAVSSSINPKLVLYLRPGNDGADSQFISMSIYTPIPGMFDGDRWNVSFGCRRNDEVDSIVSSSYFLRLATQNNGEISYYVSTASYFYETEVAGTNTLRETDPTTNTFGTYIAVGQNQTVLSGTTSGYTYLNNTTAVPSTEARVTSFTGLMSNLRFWSKALSDDEWKEHVRNYKSTGVTSPSVNWNYTHVPTGSFEKLRLDTMTKQRWRTANQTGSLGDILFLDFSVNENHMTGTGFDPSGENVLIGEIFDYSYLSPLFDEASTNQKVRVRSFQNQELINSTPWAATAPVYELVKSEVPTDSTKLSVEFSLTDALNRDIVNIFATYDAIDNALGDPALVYSPDYPDLDRLRQQYFNRIGSKLNFKSFFEFFRWFDMSIGTFIEQLIPRKTAFKGTNFVIESHMLERHKLEQHSSEIYLGESDRNRIMDRLLLQQIIGTIRKY